jgi:hypothetical protein
MFVNPSKTPSDMWEMPMFLQVCVSVYVYVCICRWYSVVSRLVRLSLHHAWHVNAFDVVVAHGAVLGSAMVCDSH